MKAETGSEVQMGMQDKREKAKEIEEG